MPPNTANPAPHADQPAPHSLAAADPAITGMADDRAAERAEDVAGDERGPLRRCLITRVQAERGRMIRFVLAPDGTITPDLAARLPGRGLWLSAKADVLDTALRKGGLVRGFARIAPRPAADLPPGAETGRAVRLPADLPASLERGLRARIASHLGLARRAGQAVAGFEKAREWLLSGRAALMVEAGDGSPDERRRLLSGARHVPMAWPLSAAELGAVFGRPHAVHVAVAAGRLAVALHEDIDRLAGLSGQVLTADGAAAAAG